MAPISEAYCLWPSSGFPMMIDFLCGSCKSNLLVSVARSKLSLILAVFSSWTYRQLPVGSFLDTLDTNICGMLLPNLIFVPSEAMLPLPLASLDQPLGFGFPHAEMSPTQKMRHTELRSQRQRQAKAVKGAAPDTGKNRGARGRVAGPTARKKKTQNSFVEAHPGLRTKSGQVLVTQRPTSCNWRQA